MNNNSSKKDKREVVYTYEGYGIKRSEIIAVIEIDNEAYYKLTNHPNELIKSNRCYKKRKELVEALKRSHRIILTQEESYIVNRILDTIREVREEREELKEITREEIIK